MHYRRDMGPRSFVMAFEAGTTVSQAALELYDAITEEVDGVSRYGYSKFGVFSAPSGRNSWVMNSTCVDGTPKKVALTTFNTYALSLEVGVNWDNVSMYLNPAARYLFNTPAVKEHIAVPTTRFSVFVFASKDWLILVPTLNLGGYSFTADLKGGIGVFNVYYTNSLQNSTSIKYILTNTACLSGTSTTYVNAGFGWYQSINVYYYLPFVTSISVASNESEAWTYNYYNGAYITTNLGAALVQQGVQPVFPVLPTFENVALTLRGKVPTVSEQEFVICGLKMGTMNTLNFLDRVTVKCGDNLNIDTEFGTDINHYALDGQGPGASPKFKYLIPS